MMPYALYPARQQGLVMAAVGKTLSQSIYMDLYHSLTRYEHAEGPASVILDLTGVEHLTMSSSFARSIVDMEPAVPVGMSRYVVAPQPVIFGLARMRANAAFAHARAGRGGALARRGLCRFRRQRSRLSARSV